MFSFHFFFHPDRGQLSTAYTAQVFQCSTVSESVLDPGGTLKVGRFLIFVEIIRIIGGKMYCNIGIIIRDLFSFC